MKTTTILTFAVALVLTSYAHAQDATKAETKPEPAEAKPAEPAPDPTAALFKNAENTVDVGGFGSNQPVERADQPKRGVIVFGKQDVVHDPRAHWEQWDWKPYKAQRWGRYAVWLTYTMKFANLQSQFKLGTNVLKNTLRASPKPSKYYLGEIYIEKPGEVSFALFAPASGAEAALDIIELSFVPAPEGPLPKQSAKGGITLEAKTATTWSETMRYEPKAEKNCLGYWTSADDMAEWEFDVIKPGKYKVSVFHGCGTGNEGSEVAVKHDGQELTFKTQDTGGFQKWKEVKVGEIEIKEAGKQRLIIDPVNKVKSAVLDVQKVVLTPVS